MTSPPDDTSGQQPGYARFPQYGEPYTPPRPPRMRGQRTIVVGAVLMGAGIVLAIIGGVVGQKNAYDKVDGFQRVAVQDVTGTVTFDDTGGYVAYYEADSVTNSTNQQIPEIPTMLTNLATGQDMILQTPYGNRSDGKIKFLHYDHHGHKGLAMWQFHIDQAGRYKVTLRNNTAAPPDAVIAFGRSIATGVVIGGVFVIIGILVLLAGIITMIVGLVLRRRHRRRLRTGGYGGAQPAGWPQGGQPFGWQPGAPPSDPQPGGQLPGYPQPPGGRPPEWPPPPDGSST